MAAAMAVRLGWPVCITALLDSGRLALKQIGNRWRPHGRSYRTQPSAGKCRRGRTAANSSPGESRLAA